MSLLYGPRRLHNVLDGPFKPAVWLAGDRRSRGRLARLAAMLKVGLYVVAACLASLVVSHAIEAAIWAVR